MTKILEAVEPHRLATICAVAITELVYSDYTPRGTTSRQARTEQNEADSG